VDDLAGRRIPRRAKRPRKGQKSRHGALWPFWDMYDTGHRQFRIFHLAGSGPSPRNPLSERSPKDRIAGANAEGPQKVRKAKRVDEMREVKPEQAVQDPTRAGTSQTICPKGRLSVRRIMPATRRLGISGALVGRTPQPSAGRRARAPSAVPTGQAHHSGPLGRPSRRPLTSILDSWRLIKAADPPVRATTSPRSTDRRPRRGTPPRAGRSRPRAGRAARAAAGLPGKGVREMAKVEPGSGGAG